MNKNEMLAVMPLEELKKIKADIEFIKHEMSLKGEDAFSEKYIESKNIPKILGVSGRTWQSYRDRKLIPYIQFGAKIWVKRADLDAFLDKHYKHAEG